MKFLFFLPLLLLSVCITQSVEAVEYTSMVTLPKISGTTNTTEEYVRILYILSISVAGILAMVKIIFAGVKYMLTDVVVSKGDAKKDIMGALLGLLIVLGAVLILNTINPQITTLNLFQNDSRTGSTIVGTGGESGEGEEAEECNSGLAGITCPCGQTIEVTGGTVAGGYRCIDI